MWPHKAIKKALLLMGFIGSIYLPNSSRSFPQVLILWPKPLRHGNMIRKRYVIPCQMSSASPRVSGSD